VATLCEMAFASGCGLDIDLASQVASEDRAGVLAALFNEELGAVVQVRTSDRDEVLRTLEQYGLSNLTHDMGAPRNDSRVEIRCGETPVFASTRDMLRADWSQTTHQMQRLRDDRASADEEHTSRLEPTNPGLVPHVPFDLAADRVAPLIATGVRPRMAILREQGVNGQIEMAAAFDRAGFECVDVHMSDLQAGALELTGFKGLVACGGFSYGDVLGAGEGWAKAILFDSRTRDQFSAFFERSDTFALGVCNGCQALSNLRELIPGATGWPRFVRNRSEQFEARLAQVTIEPSPSVLLAGMEGARLPIAVAHGEGRAEFGDGDLARIEGADLVAARFSTGHGETAVRYPDNPNGSPAGITAITTPDGRVTIMMPHPERVFRTVQYSWHPEGWGEDAPWMRLFRNARLFIG